MIKATGHNNDGIVVFLGLSFANLHRLQEGQPIAVDLNDLLTDDERPRTVVIHAGKNEQAILEELRANGVRLTDATLNGEPSTS